MTIPAIVLLIIFSPFLLFLSIMVVMLAFLVVVNIVMGPIGILAMMFFPNSEFAKSFEEHLP